MAYGIDDSPTFAPSQKAIRFNAFISYSHAADGRLAPELQRALQRFARPWNKGTALRIFRDETDLSVNPALWLSVEQALKASEYFLLLASPDAGTSKWVHREVEYWRKHRSADRLLLVLTAGEIAWQDAASDFDWEKTNALPGNLTGFFQEQPRHIDLRWVKTEEQWSLRNMRFRDAIAEIAAPLHGKSKSDLESEEVRQEGTVRRLKWSAITALACLAVAAMVAAVLAVRSARDARTQATIADQQRHRAVARMLATEAASVLDNANARMDLGTRQLHAVLLGVESLKEEPTPQGTEVVHRALSIMPTPLRTFDAYEGSSIDVSEGGRVLAATLPSGDIKVWDVATGRALLSVSEPLDSQPEIAISGDGRILARSRWRYPAKANERPRVIVTEVTTGRELANIDLPLPPLHIALSSDGAQLVMADRKRIQLFDARRATLIATLAPQRGNARTGGLSQSLKFDSTGQHVAVLGGGVVEMLATKAGDGAKTTHALAKLEDDDSRILSAVSGDGRRVAAGDATGTIQVWDTEALTEVARVEHGDSYIQEIALSTSGGWLAGVSRRGTLTVWSLPDGIMPTVMAGPPQWRSDIDPHITLTEDGDARVALSQGWGSIDSVGAGGTTLRIPIPGSSSAVAANRDGSRIAVSDAYDFARIYDTRSGEEIARVATPAEDFGGIVDSLALSGDGARLAVGGDFEIVRVFDVSTGKLLLKLSGKRGPAERKAVFALDDAGQHLAVVSPEGTLTIFPIDGTRPLTTRDLASPVGRLAFSRDREYLVLAGLDSTIRVLDATLLEERARIPYQLNVATVALTADNKRVRVGLYDGSVREGVWQPQDVIAQACSVVGRNFSQSEWPRYFPDEPFRRICEK